MGVLVNRLRHLRLLLYSWHLPVRMTPTGLRSRVMSLPLTQVPLPAWRRVLRLRGWAWVARAPVLRLVRPQVARTQQGRQPEPPAQALAQVPRPAASGWRLMVTARELRPALVAQPALPLRQVQRARLWRARRQRAGA